VGGDGQQPSRKPQSRLSSGRSLLRILHHRLHGWGSLGPATIGTCFSALFSLLSSLPYALRSERRTADSLPEPPCPFTRQPATASASSVAPSSLHRPQIAPKPSQSRRRYQFARPINVNLDRELRIDAHRNSPVMPIKSPYADMEIPAVDLWTLYMETPREYPDDHRTNTPLFLLFALALATTYAIPCHLEPS
jgi:hypothetical protein